MTTIQIATSITILLTVLTLAGGFYMLTKRNT